MPPFFKKPIVILIIIIIAGFLGYFAYLIISSKINDKKEPSDNIQLTQINPTFFDHSIEFQKYASPNERSVMVLKDLESSYTHIPNGIARYPFKTTLPENLIYTYKNSRVQNSIVYFITFNEGRCTLLALQDYKSSDFQKIVDFNCTKNVQLFVSPKMTKIALFDRLLTNDKSAAAINIIELKTKEIYQLPVPKYTSILSAEFMSRVSGEEKKEDIKEEVPFSVHTIWLSDEKDEIGVYYDSHSDNLSSLINYKNGNSLYSENKVRILEISSDFNWRLLYKNKSYILQSVNGKEYNLPIEMSADILSPFVALTTKSVFNNSGTSFAWYARANGKELLQTIDLETGNIQTNQISYQISQIIPTYSGNGWYVIGHVKDLNSIYDKGRFKIPSAILQNNGKIDESFIMVLDNASVDFDFAGWIVQ